jgi:hypothetical protein
MHITLIILIVCLPDETHQPKRFWQRQAILPVFHLGAKQQFYGKPPADG